MRLRLHCWAWSQTRSSLGHARCAHQVASSNRRAEPRGAGGAPRGGAGSTPLPPRAALAAGNCAPTGFTREARRSRPEPRAIRSAARRCRGADGDAGAERVVLEHAARYRPGASQRQSVRGPGQRRNATQRARRRSRRVSRPSRPSSSRRASAFAPARASSGASVRIASRCQGSSSRACSEERHRGLVAARAREGVAAVDQGRDRVRAAAAEHVQPRELEAEPGVEREGGGRRRVHGGGAVGEPLGEVAAGGGPEAARAPLGVAEPGEERPELHVHRGILGVGRERLAVPGRRALHAPAGPRVVGGGDDLGPGPGLLAEERHGGVEAPWVRLPGTKAITWPGVRASAPRGRTPAMAEEVLIVAGEASADLHASRVLEELSEAPPGGPRVRRGRAAPAGRRPRGAGAGRGHLGDGARPR